MFYDLRIESSRYLVCFLFLLASELENELDLSIYNLSLKTSYYMFSDDNRLAVFKIRLAAFMLPLQQKFEFQNIRHAAYHIQIVVYAPEAYCPKSGLSLTISG